MSLSKLKNLFGLLEGHEQPKLVLIASYSSVAVSLIIIIAKLIGWILTDSLTLLASLADSLLDITASFINLVAIKYAQQPPDHEHRFGHTKAEDLAVFAQSSIFAISGVLIAFSAVERFFSPLRVENSAIGIGIIVFSIVLTILLITVQKFVIGKTNSHVISADHLHFKTDLLANIVIIFSLYFSSQFNVMFLDPLCALLIAMYLLHGAWELLQRAFNNLMDHEFTDAEKDKLKLIIKAHPKTIGLHDLRTRYAGTKPFIQFHLELDGTISLNEAHAISDEIEVMLIAEYPGADIIIHQDPHGIDEVIAYPC
jgi:cation diffusion facilitator family transporter